MEPLQSSEAALPLASAVDQAETAQETQTSET